MYCMMQWIKQLRLNIFFITNKQNRSQNKEVNMVNGNNLKNIIIGHISDQCFLNIDVYIFTTEWYLDLYMVYIISNERILPNFLKMCVFILG